MKLRMNREARLINNTKVKYEETIYVRHTALTPAVVKINRF